MPVCVQYLLRSLQAGVFVHCFVRIMCRLLAGWLGQQGWCWVGCCKTCVSPFSQAGCYASVAACSQGWQHDMLAGHLLCVHSGCIDGLHRLPRLHMSVAPAAGGCWHPPARHGQGSRRRVQLWWYAGAACRGRQHCCYRHHKREWHAWRATCGCATTSSSAKQAGHRVGNALPS